MNEVTIHEKIRQAARIMPHEAFLERIEQMRQEARRTPHPAERAALLGLVAFAEAEAQQVAKTRQAAKPDPVNLIPVVVAVGKIGGAVAVMWLVGCVVVEGLLALKAFVIANALPIGWAVSALVVLIVLVSSGKVSGKRTTDDGQNENGRTTDNQGTNFYFNIHVGHDGQQTQS
jgi:hypothetical protein